MDSRHPTFMVTATMLFCPPLTNRRETLITQLQIEHGMYDISHPTRHGDKTLYRHRYNLPISHRGLGLAPAL